MKEEILVFALENAIEHDGRATAGPVMGKIMAAHPELKRNAKELAKEVAQVVNEVNGMSHGEMKDRLEQLGGPIELRKRERKDPMSDLPDTEKGVRMRFAPGPSGPLHIGHTRAAILNDEYCRRYDGTFILRLEDTNPEKIDPDAYKMIPEDLEWLGINVSEHYIQSDRFDHYYETIRDLLTNGKAYVCTMDPEEWRDLKNSSKPCPERNAAEDEQLEKWDRMLAGDYDEGEASAVVKTDLHHKNPAVRDFVAMRIRYGSHPRTGDRYHVYPLYNFSVAVDDHMMGCTHILRGNDHLNNTFRQKYVYDHMGWKYPHFIHYGLVSIPDTLLKTSSIREEIEKGRFSGWDDVRLGTVRALARRGFDPEAIRRYWKEVGIKPVDIAFSWETLETMNRELIDRIADRYFFVEDPVKMAIITDSGIKGRSPKHPEISDRGYREYDLKRQDGRVFVNLPSKEIKGFKEGDLVRLKDLCNIRIGDGCRFAYHEGNDPYTAREEGTPIIHWAPEGSPFCEIVMPDGKVLTGVAEEEVLDAAGNNRTVQFERVGFCRMEMNGHPTGYFAHK